ncbi:ABC transporter ATP-binding protein [Stackebrandtia soli]|uniref:ABC transporter ATP-binding protein n=1 Tax=Stackebrandtia soli TaxID=1892856 RepID=UPI0039E9D1B9
MKPQVASGDTPTGGTTTTEAAITATGVTVRYGSKVAVDNVDFSVAAGQIVGLIGPNGAGKTSLMECIEGLRKSSAGDIRVLGVDPVRDRTAMARIAGVQLQDSAYPTRTRVDELCTLFAGFYQDPADPDELLEQFGLTEKKRSQVTKLSGGQRQRLSLVLSLIGKPEIVFLDELTTGLDPEARRTVWDGLRRRNEEGLTIVLSSHHMEEVEYLCDRVSVIVAGSIVATGSVAELIAAHATGGERIIVEDAASHGALREALVELGDGVTVTPAGNRIQVDIDDASLRDRVTALFDEHSAVSRAVTASMDDVYVALTKQHATDGE